MTYREKKNLIILGLIAIADIVVACISLFECFKYDKLGICDLSGIKMDCINLYMLTSFGLFLFIGLIMLIFAILPLFKPLFNKIRFNNYISDPKGNKYSNHNLEFGFKYSIVYIVAFISHVLIFIIELFVCKKYVSNSGPYSIFENGLFISFLIISGKV